MERREQCSDESGASTAAESEYVPDSNDSESSSQREAAEFLPVISVPKASAVAKKWKSTLPKFTGGCALPAKRHKANETAEAHQLKAAGLFTDTCTGRRLAETTSSGETTSPGVLHPSQTPASTLGISEVGGSNLAEATSSGVIHALEVPSSTSGTSKFTVHVAKNTNGKRVFDKKSKCTFCDVFTTNLTKHFLSKKHRDEPEVAEILSKPKNSKEREWLLEKLRNRGNYQHNCCVLQAQEGEIIPWRSPPEQVDPHDYVPCTFCLGFFLRKELWRHEKACKFKTESKNRRRVISRAVALLPSEMDQTASEGYRQNVIECMNCDEITFVAKRDHIITSYGEKLYQKHGHLEHKRAYIRQKIRELARFLRAARDKDSTITDFHSCLVPCRFPLVVSVVKRLCGYDSDKNAYSNPSLALKLGHSLKKCASILRNQALMQGDLDLQKRAADFRELCESDWKEYISSCAISTLEERSYNKPHVLPLTEDLMKLTQHMETERAECLSELRSNPSSLTWHNLAKVSLANIIMFNRRRSGEASRMLIMAFEAAKANSQPEDDVLEALSEMEKQLVNNFMRVEVRGKRKRKVPVLLTRSMQTEIEELQKHREEAGINPDNKYVFARPYFNAKSHLPGHSCLRKAVEKSGATHPENLTSTKLRKHLATVSQILNLKDNELEQLCGFLGHNISVHREFYRLPQDTLQLAKVSRLLVAAESGQMAKFQGKTLEDIHLDQELEFHDSDVEFEEPEAEAVQKIQAAETETMHRGRSEEWRRAAKRTRESSRSSGEEELVICKRSAKRDFLTSAQTALITHHFKSHIDNCAIPRKEECEDLLNKEPLLQDKSWLKLKCTVRNEIEKRKRQVKRLQKQ